MGRPGVTVRRPEYVGDPLRSAVAALPRLRQSTLRVAIRQPWFWLALGALALLIAGLVYVLDIASFFVMSDEMTYMKEAVHTFERGSPLPTTDLYYGSVSQLPSILRAPTLLVGNVPTAWDAMRVENLVLFLSAAWPAYVIARELTCWRSVAVGTALAVVAVPWIVISGSLLTDALSYSAFVWALAAMYRGMTRPSWKTDLVALIAIGVAAGMRSQQLVLYGAYVAAVVAHEVGWALRRRGDEPAGVALRRAARGHVIVLVTPLVLLVAVGAVGLNQFRADLLGNYSVAGAGALLPPGTLVVSRELTGLIGIGIAALPVGLAAAFIVATLWRPDSREHHAYSVLSLFAGVATLIVASSFIVRFTAGAGLSERYACYLAPLFLLGTAGALSRRLPIAALAVGAAYTWWTFSGIPILVESRNVFAPAAPFHTFVNQHLNDFATSLPGHFKPATVIAAGAIVVLALMAIPRRLVRGRAFAAGLGGVLLAAIVAQTLYAMHAIAGPESGANAQYLANRDWVDKSIGWDHRVAAVIGELYGPQTSVEAWWEATFWNRSVDHGYTVIPGGESFGQERSSTLKIDPRTGALNGFAGEHYLLSSSRDQRFRVAGVRTIRNLGELTLAKLPAHPRVTWWANGIDSTGRLAGGTSAVLRTYSGTGPSELWAERAEPKHPETLVLSAPGWTRTLVLPASGQPVRVTLPRDAKLIRIANRGAPKTTQARVAFTGPPLPEGL